MDDPVCHHPDCADVERLREALRKARGANIILAHSMERSDFARREYQAIADAIDAALVPGKPLSQHPDSSEPQTPGEWKLLAEKLTEEIGEWREKQVTAITAAMLVASKMARKFYPETPKYYPPADICTALVHIEDMMSRLARKEETANQIRRLMAERDTLLGAIAPADYEKIQPQMIAISESPDTPPEKGVPQ